MKQARIAIIPVALAVICGLVIFTIFFTPFHPLVINYRGDWEDRPDLNSREFARELNLVLWSRDEVGIRIGFVVFVTKALAKDDGLRAKYSNAAEINLNEN